MFVKSAGENGLHDLTYRGITNHFGNASLWFSAHTNGWRETIYKGSWAHHLDRPIRMYLLIFCHSFSRIISGCLLLVAGLL